MIKYPPKLKDPGSFILPCTFRKLENVESLCNLGASVNLVPSFIYKKFEIRELTPTTIKLQYADRSIKQPLGVVENILGKVGKFFFSADFYVLEMNDACNTLIILGKSFLATGGVFIELTKESILFRMGKEIEEFHVSKSVHNQLLNHDETRVYYLETCCMVSRPPPLNPLSDTQGEEQLKKKPQVCPKQVELEKQTSAREKVDKKEVESGSAKPKGKENNFVEVQHVYYFPPKNHFLYNPKHSMCGPFMVSKVHSFGPIDIILYDHKPITVYRKRLKPLKESTFRIIWCPK